MLPVNTLKNKARQQIDAMDLLRLMTKMLKL